MADNDDVMIAALLRERAGYEVRGLPERVAAVDEQLAMRGHKAAPSGGVQRTADASAPLEKRGPGRPRKSS